jgi:hypothetical protein
MKGNMRVKELEDLAVLQAKAIEALQQASLRAIV